MSERGVTRNQSVIWMSAGLFVGTLVWNVVKGDWTDALFLVGLGIGGALLLCARWKEGKSDSIVSALRWSGLFLIGGIALLQIVLLIRYLMSL